LVSKYRRHLFVTPYRLAISSLLVAFRSSSFMFFLPLSKAAASRVGHFDRPVIYCPFILGGDGTGHFYRPVICSLSLYLRRRRHGSGILIVQLYVLYPFNLGGSGTGGAFRSSSYMFFAPRRRRHRSGHFDRPVLLSLSLYRRRRRHGHGISIV
jgi:hypothetical protein